MGLMGTTLLGVTGEVEAEGVMVVPGEVGPRPAPIAWICEITNSAFFSLKPSGRSMVFIVSRPVKIT